MVHSAGAPASTPTETKQKQREQQSGKQQRKTTVAAHLLSSDSEGEVEADRSAIPDAQALIYPCTNPDGWLEEENCGFWRAKVDSPQVQSLVGGREQLRPGPNFVLPPPTFVCASVVDDVCPVESDADPYVEAARRAGATVQYLRGDFGDHGFGLKRFWATPCARWLEGLGFGVPRGKQPPSTPPE